MKPNGRRAWRKAAKKLRRTMGRRWRSQEEWVHGKRWSELVPDLEAHRAHVTGAWFKRHGFTEQVPEKLDAQHLVRVYVGLWGTVDGDSVTYAMKPESFTARSLVGMTMGERKRKAWTAYQSGLSESWSFWCAKYGIGESLRHREGERLRPCPGCCACWGHRISSAYGEIAECCGPQTSGKRKSQIKAMRKWQETLADNCDGSGVLPAKSTKAKRPA